MMACVPKAYFLEHFTMKLRRESAANLLGNLLDCKLQLLRSIRQAVPGYSLLLTNDHNNHTAPPATDFVLLQQKMRGMFTPSLVISWSKNYCHARKICTLWIHQCLHSAVTHRVSWWNCEGIAWQAMNLSLHMDVLLMQSTTFVWTLSSTFQVWKLCWSKYFSWSRPWNRRTYFNSYSTNCACKSIRRRMSSSYSPKLDGELYFIQLNVPLWSNLRAQLCQAR